MSTGIVIYEKNDYVFTLLKSRLSIYFPDSYIFRAGSDDLSQGNGELASITDVIYDDHQFSEYEVREFSNSFSSNTDELIPLYSISDDGKECIDCSTLARLLSRNTKDSILDGNLTINHAINKPGKTLLLLPFAYISERESYIDHMLQDFKNETDICLRLDIMSGIRMPQRFTTATDKGSLTALLKLAQKDTLTINDIPNYCNPDGYGFITPGKPENSDDVFDYGFQAIEKLIKTASEFSHQEDMPVNTCIVMEGFRFADLRKAASIADELHILFPRELYSRDISFKTEIGSLIRQVKFGCKIITAYSDDYKESKLHETVTI